MNTAYFISDAHLGINIPGHEDREAILCKFLREIAPRADHLFIVGDLFDFWIEYRWALRPDYFPLLHHLRTLVETGTEIHYCLGNHDFAMGGFMEEKIGIKIHPEGFKGVIQGKKLLVTHGDELRGSQFLRRVLRNPVLQSLYKIIHPNIGVPLGEFFSGLSRDHFKTYADEGILEDYRQSARRILASGYDIFIFGHTHVPELIRFDEGIYCNTGNWISRYSYVDLSGGKINLRKYNPNEKEGNQ
ncbi:MAG: UDP-2,3-diacylglucosamine diphosphatase [Candidatus Auribacterota bacterium]|nr:UDP-2,3-diacylglucosamine diphosphatase [Candidatus Auribacterota bacterium]